MEREREGREGEGGVVGVDSSLEYVLFSLSLFSVVEKRKEMKNESEEKKKEVKKFLFWVVDPSLMLSLPPSSHSIPSAPIPKFLVSPSIPLLTFHHNGASMTIVTIIQGKERKKKEKKRGRHFISFPSSPSLPTSSLSRTATSKKAREKEK